MKVTVIGLGKIGLPLAINCARNGAMVTGLDLQEDVVRQINSGVEPFPGEKDLLIRLKESIANSRLIASTNVEECLSSAEVLFFQMEPLTLRILID